MRNKGFYIKSVIATGDGMILSRVDFRRGCNLLFGPSEMGKSSVFSVIDYLLGKKENPKEVKEGEGYDTFYMEYVTCSDSVTHTVRRYLNDNQVLVKDCAYEAFESLAFKGTGYPLESKTKKDYSKYLMEINGFPDSLELKKTTVTKASFRYTWIRHLILADENRIVSEKPIFNPNNDTSVRQQEKSVIYYLTSGRDDSEFVPGEADKIRKARYKGKIELTEENIKAIESRLAELGDVGYADFNDDSVIMAIQSQIIDKERSLNALFEKRKELEEEKRKLLSKKLFNIEFVKRMEMLEKHYRTDVERFQYLYQGADLFSLLEQNHECPLCHSTITDTANVNNEYLEAIESECGILQSKITDIQKMIGQKKGLLYKYNKQENNIDASLSEINADISGFTATLDSLRATLQKYQDNIEKKAEVKFLSEESGRLYHKLAMLKTEEVAKPQTETYTRTTNIREVFCNKLKEKLVDWNVIGAGAAVVFDEHGFDFVLGGKKRLTCGKGARGVTCSAILMTLLEYCDEKNIPFSNLLVLDSPITAHFDEETEDLDETTQSKFFKYCNDNINDYQLIIIDNKSPNEEERRVLTNINYIEFSKNGRNGFYLGKIESK